MKKIHLDNGYENIFKDDKEIFALSLPITLIHKFIFNQSMDILQTKYDITNSELDVLASLQFNGKILTPTDLYEATIFSSGGMSKILKKLKDKKLISRVPSKQDKRSLLVKIEQKGEDLVNTSLQDMIDMDNEIFSILDKKEKESLKLILKKLVYSFINE